MMYRNAVSRIVAVTLIAAMHVALAPAYVAADPEQASLSGNILSRDTRAPMSGAVVHATDPRTSASFFSQPAGDDGHFEIAEMPPASYMLAVESQGGLYLVDAPVVLVPGHSRSVQLALNPKKDKSEEEEDDDGLAMTFLDNPVTATLAIVGSAILIGLLIDEGDNDDPIDASPYIPE